MYIKNKDMLFTSYCTFLQMYSQQKRLLSALDLFQTISESDLIPPYLVEQNEVNKKSFLSAFHSAKSISNHFRTSKNFQIFSQKNLKILKFFPSLRPYRKIFISIENEFIPSSK